RREVHRVRGAANHDQLSLRKPTRGVLGPPLRNDRITRAAHDEHRHVEVPELVLDAIAQRVAERRDDSAHAGIAIVLSHHGSEGGPRGRALEWRVEGPAKTAVGTPSAREDPWWGPWSTARVI